MLMTSVSVIAKKNKGTIELKLNLNKIENRATSNGFKFSKSKTQCVHFCQLCKQHGDPGSPVVEYLTRDRGAAGSSLTSVTVLWSLSETDYSSLVQVQPRKTRPSLTESLLMGREESNQTEKFICILVTHKIKYSNEQNFVQCLVNNFDYK